MRLLKAMAVGFSLAVSCLCPPSYADEQVSSLKNKQDEFALARKTLRSAAEIAVRIKDPIGRVHVVSWIAISQARVEDVPGALKTSAKIGDPKRTVLAMADIAAAQAKQGQELESTKTFQQARNLAASLKDKWDGAHAFGKIGELEAKSQNADAVNDFAQAIQIANTLPSDHEKASVLFYIGASQLGSDNLQAAATFKEASLLLSTDQDDMRKWMTAFQLAPFQVRAGDDQGAITTALTFTDKEDHHYRSQVLSSVASEQARKGNIDAALKTSSSIENEAIREETLRWIVEAHAKNGNIEGAMHTTETIQKNWEAKTFALLYIANAQVDAGRSAEADKTVEQAIDLFQKGVSGSPQKLRWSQILVVESLLKMQQLKKATEAAEVSTLGVVKAQALSMVAEASAKTGDRVTADRLLEEAMQLENKAPSWQRIAEAYAQIGNVRIALKAASKIPREFDRSYALQRIADVQTKNGDARGALKWAESLMSPYLKSSALLGVALGILQKFGIEVGGSV